MICINCEVNHIVNWYKECVISSNALAAQATILKKKLCFSCNSLNSRQNFEQIK